ncbi:hypothetical protein K439DRAFT_1637880 [Ramaria rubella]|nr:hypothetical protein K439DRAFT_1637880 [Ramaria rubella]
MSSPSGGNPAVTYTPMLYGVMTSAILTGINICQGYAYMTSHVDRWVFKGLLLFLLLVDLVGTIVSTALLDHNLIGGFGDPTGAVLFSIPNFLFFDSLSPVIITTAVQAYIARQIYRVDRRWWPLSMVILVCVLAEFGLGIYVVEQVAIFRAIQTLGDDKRFHIISGLWNVLAAFVDVIATFGLCALLHTVRTPFKKTNNIINRIMMNFINRGLLVTIFQVVFVALWFGQPTTLNWSAVYFSNSKLYMTTMLAILNMGNRSQNKERSSDPGSLDISYPRNSRGTSHVQSINPIGTLLSDPAAIQISRTVETHDDQESFQMKSYKSDHDGAL